MKRLITVALVVSLIGTLGFVLSSDASAAPKPKSPVIGDWQAVDPDGTDWLLSIWGGHGALHLDGSDALADECPTPGPARAIGKGVIDETDSNTIHVRFHAWCKEHGRWRTAGEVTFVYNPAIDQMVMDGSLVWTRR